MLIALAKRLGLIFGFALVVFAIGSVKNMIDPPQGQANARPNMEHTKLAAPLHDPVMQSALSQLRASGRYEGETGGGARLVFPSVSGQVTLSSSDVQALNALYRAINNGAPAALTHEQRLEELRRENLDYNGWGRDTSY
ncbi:hypothetical protein [Qipengyuania aquimaris]|uniref:Uncharacterized protein n=1 Tax=Qipengyuania aquimaris TaxID=255984 RepID=A0A9Q3S1P5_9SPHN|nr:hypothetical protein [Qipengyuania aquimaris]MBY6218358.1 hypothetical protein [Qipengyuania aquimaris]